ncbi:hypothetical protein CYMTET_13866 [Cymbomonas tetramitiformis]|uniref:Phosphatidic acid phosphatase type 2/haloperoxidase domain-containing protein n=1 Tax=Cymbomonas tetramitiformis TaxID=36881 RepID=A0AAE0GIM6_9CHLO|nr:hypothetical protein CYMTET_13866 [Cymbomonas tetramitiformis]
MISNSFVHTKVAVKCHPKINQRSSRSVARNHVHKARQEKLGDAQSSLFGSEDLYWAAAFRGQLVHVSHTQRRSAGIHRAATRSAAPKAQKTSEKVARSETVEAERREELSAKTSSVLSSNTQTQGLVQNYEVAPAILDGRALLFSATIFVALALDLNSSAHLMGNVDVPVHQFVSNNIAESGLRFWDEVSAYPFDLALLASVGGLLAGATSSNNDMRARALRALGVCALIYFGGGGGIPHGDPLLVGFLKENFHRIRPSELLHHTYAFPSGHTTASSFTTGLFLWVHP